MCKEGCPVNTPINEVIQMLLNEDIMGSGEKLFKNNPLSVVCSLVCPHEKQCEGHCVLGKKGNPVKIRDSTRCCESTKNEHRTFATGVIPGRHDDRDESEDLP